MTLAFPSQEFDRVVAAVCDGCPSEAELRALNVLLRNHPGARDEYLFRVELHSRLASAPDLFSPATDLADACGIPGLNLPEVEALPANRPAQGFAWRKPAPALALAAGLAMLCLAVWGIWFRGAGPRNTATSTAVAMLTRVVDARWSQGNATLRTGGALEPGWLRLESGLAQIVFYSGARVVIEGPAELQILSQSEAACPSGRLLAEVPEPARGFRLRTSQVNVVDLGTAFGVAATRGATEVHVFKGKVELLEAGAARQSLGEGQAAAAQVNSPLRLMPADTAAFSSLFEFQQRLLASEALRYEQWQFAGAQLNRDPALVVRLDFENQGSSDWTLRNLAEAGRSVPEATLVGCQPGEGRWREKQALEFQSVNDRVRLTVPGDFESLTLSAWARVAGLDRQFNSLFMCDGFEPGTVHWLIRKDGVLGLTVFGARPGNAEIAASPPALALDKLGTWLHLAVVVDGGAGRVVHYVNGAPVSRHDLKLSPPFRIGPAELGNWNARSGPNPAPNLIRNLSGALDEFALFSRALSAAEVHDLYVKGKPDA